MIDIKVIRENRERFVKAAKDKNIKVDISRLLDTDKVISESKTALQQILTEKNLIGKSVPKLSGAEKESALGKLAELKKTETSHNEKLKQLQPEYDSLMQLVAQPADDEVPFGKDDTENVELRREGQVRK